jgi:hypothetical protein
MIPYEKKQALAGCLQGDTVLVVKSEIPEDFRHGIADDMFKPGRGEDLICNIENIVPTGIILSTGYIYPYTCIRVLSDNYGSRLECVDYYPGQTVLVAREPVIYKQHNPEMEWGCWTEAKQEWVGKTGKIHKIIYRGESSVQGIVLEENKRLVFPFFILELVKDCKRKRERMPKHPVLIGSDPEFNIFKGKELLRAESVLREDGRDLYHSEIGVDGHSTTGELRPPHGTAHQHFLNLKTIVHELYDKVRKDKLAVDLIGNQEALGFHVHLSFPELRIKNRAGFYQTVTRSLDAILGKYLLDLSGISRSCYKQLGQYREQSHGMEYRSLPAICYQTPEMAKIVYKLAQKTGTYCRKNYHNKEALEALRNKPTYFIEQFLTPKQNTYYWDFIKKYTPAAARQQAESTMFNFWIKKSTLQAIESIYFASTGDYNMDLKKLIRDLFKDVTDNIYFFGLSRQRGNYIYVSLPSIPESIPGLEGFLNLWNCQEIIPSGAKDIPNCVMVGLPFNLRNNSNLVRQVSAICNNIIQKYFQSNSFDFITASFSDYLDAIKKERACLEDKTVVIAPEHTRFRCLNGTNQVSLFNDMTHTTHLLEVPGINADNYRKYVFLSPLQANMICYQNKYTLDSRTELIRAEQHELFKIKSVSIRQNGRVRTIFVPLDTEIVTMPKPKKKKDASPRILPSMDEIFSAHIIDDEYVRGNLTTTTETERSET